MDFRFYSICFILVCLLIIDNPIQGKALDKRGLFDDLLDDYENGESEDYAGAPPGSNQNNPTNNAYEQDDESDLDYGWDAQLGPKSVTEDSVTQELEIQSDDLSEDSSTDASEYLDY